MRQFSSYLVTSRARYATAIGFIPSGGDIYQTPEPVYRAFEQLVVVAASEREARDLYIRDHKPKGATHVDVLTVQRLGPYSIDTYKQQRAAIALAA